MIKESLIHQAISSARIVGTTPRPTAQVSDASHKRDRKKHSSGAGCDPREAIVAFTVGRDSVGRAGGIGEEQGRVGGSGDP